ncbi:MAG TPA: hypothetical protein VLF69_00745 [Candidatus Saccharimonadales bacterium]|nr:hypothetical protein [Candidatus Saccharimonadales bacterium]
MKLLVLYRPNSEFARTVEEFIQTLRVQQNIDERQLEILDFDSREGSATASLYDIIAQPGFVVVGDDGGFIKSWQGNELPLAEEVASYTLSY